MLSLFDNISPFPSGLPIAPIAIISHEKLLNGDRDEAARVLEACETHGFFYLNLKDTTQGEALLGEADQLHALANNAFASPLHEKLPYALERGVSLFGYKPAGTVKTTDQDQRPDSTEFFNISKDHLHNLANPDSTKSIHYPPMIEAHRPLFQSFTRRGHACGMLILHTLASQLGLPPDEFTNLNLFDRPSGDHVRLTHKPPTTYSSDTTTAAAAAASPPSIGLPSHTDFGSVTILFNWLGGLQIESHTCSKEQQREWLWVKPLPGHAIINLGDAMVTFTNGALKSAKHRVVPSPGQQGAVDRYSVVYFVRPHNDVPMKSLRQFSDGGNDRDAGAVQVVAGKFSAALGRGEEVLTAGEWMRQRAVQLGN